MLENISVERVCSVFNHVVNIGGHNEISDCDFVAGDELAAATSKDSFDQFSVIKGSILETFQLLFNPDAQSVVNGENVKKKCSSCLDK